MAIYIAIKAQIIRFSDSRVGGSRIPETINKLDSQPRLQGNSPSNFLVTPHPVPLLIWTFYFVVIIFLILRIICGVSPRVTQL